MPFNRVVRSSHSVEGIAIDFHMRMWLRGIGRVDVRCYEPMKPAQLPSVPMEQDAGLILSVGASFARDLTGTDGSLYRRCDSNAKCLLMERVFKCGVNLR